MDMLIGSGDHASGSMLLILQNMIYKDLSKNRGIWEIKVGIHSVKSHVLSKSYDEPLIQNFTPQHN